MFSISFVSDGFVDVLQLSIFAPLYLMFYQDDV